MSLDQNIYNADIQYLNALREVRTKGVCRKTRNGEVLSMFSLKMDIDIADTFPLLTTKKMYWKGILLELLWFIKGDTNALHLSQNGVHIWDGNSSQEFLGKIGLTQYKEGDCGPIYGFQWRHYNASYKGCDEKYDGKGIDQLQNCIDLIKNDPLSRRIFMSAWNPCQLPEMCLPPCHVSYQFYVDIDDDGTKHLSCMMMQRSGDMFLGVPFNIASTALLTNMIASITGCKPKSIHVVIGDAHIYKEHIEQVDLQLERDPLSLPKLNITRLVEKIEDFSKNDFEVIEYKSHPAIKAAMIA